MSTPQMIRKATAADFAEILALNDSFVPKVSKVDEAWLAKYLHEADLFDVYIDSGKVVAFIVGMNPNVDYHSENFLWFKMRYENFLYIDRIAVAESAQGKGVGKKLYERVEKAIAKKFAFLAGEVNVQPPNPQSFEFHRKRGFTEVGQQDTKGGTIRVAMLMKSLK